ncbi:MAG TPA: hypothetical protein VHJ82_05170 [Actinomycetota bacterium]|nr:hypothetical protein [Actinomycetota bacterium]
MIWIATLFVVGVAITALRRGLEGAERRRHLLVLASNLAYIVVAVVHFFEHLNHEEVDWAHFLLGATKIAALVGVMWVIATRARRGPVPNDLEELEPTPLPAFRPSRDLVSWREIGAIWRDAPPATGRTPFGEFLESQSPPGDAAFPQVVPVPFWVVLVQVSNLRAGVDIGQLANGWALSVARLLPATTKTGRKPRKFG